jgi:hypothetical protein
MKKEEQIIWTLGIILIMLICFNLISNNSIESKKLKEVDINICKNKSINEASECLRDWIKTFFNYTVRDDTKKSLKDLQENGGDCFDYTYLYQSNLEELGFLTKKVSIYPEGNGSGHTFLIAWDKNLTGYCKIDMLNLKCVEFEDE